MLHNRAPGRALKPRGGISATHMYAILLTLAAFCMIALYETHYGHR